MHHNNIRLLKAALFSIGAGAIVGGLWLGLSALKASSFRGVAITTMLTR